MIVLTTIKRKWKLVLIIFLLLISVIYGFNLAREYYVSKEDKRVINEATKIIEQVKTVGKINDVVDVMSDDDVDNELHNKGWYRD